MYVENAFIMWIYEMWNSGVHLTDALIQEKAKQLRLQSGADVGETYGWGHATDLDGCMVLKTGMNFSRIGHMVNQPTLIHLRLSPRCRNNAHLLSSMVQKMSLTSMNLALTAAALHHVQSALPPFQGGRGSRVESPFLCAQTQRELNDYLYFLLVILAFHAALMV